MLVQDETEVHRIVLPYRAWDLLGLVGREQATTMLRQSVRYCVKAESWGGRNRSRELLPKLLEEHRLLDAMPGTRLAEDQWVEDLSMTRVRPPCAGDGGSQDALEPGIKQCRRPQTPSTQSAWKPFAVHGAAEAARRGDPW